MSTKVVNIECTAFWCMPHKANKYGNITMDAGRLDDDTVKMLKSEGIKVNFDTDNDPEDPDFKGFFVKPKATAPVEVKDMQNNVLPEKLLIGNGSKMILGLGIKTWVHPPTQKSGKKLVWLTAKVKEYVPYDPDASLKAKAEAMTDGISGDGFVFGESGADDNDEPEGSQEVAQPANDNENDEFNQLFGDQ